MKPPKVARAEVMEIDVLIEDPAWDGVTLEDWAGRACPATLAALGLDPSEFAVSILACDDARIATLNADFRGKPSPTNVLSWPSEDLARPLGGMPDLPKPDGRGPHELGDIALAHGVCLREAAEQGKDFGDHVTHLLVHSTLHLLGFDHIDDADAAVMEKLEISILARLGIANPY